MQAEAARVAVTESMPGGQAPRKTQPFHPIQEGTMRLVVISAYKSPERLVTPGEVIDASPELAKKLLDKKLVRPLIVPPERAVSPSEEMRVDLSRLSMADLRAEAADRGIAVPGSVRSKLALVALIEGR